MVKPITRVRCDVSSQAPHNAPRHGERSRWSQVRGLWGKSSPWCWLCCVRGSTGMVQREKRPEFSPSSHKPTEQLLQWPGRDSKRAGLFLLGSTPSGD